MFGPMKMLAKGIICINVLFTMVCIMFSQLCMPYYYETDDRHQVMEKDCMAFGQVS